MVHGAGSPFDGAAFGGADDVAFGLTAKRDDARPADDAVTAGPVPVAESGDCRPPKGKMHPRKDPDLPFIAF